VAAVEPGWGRLTNPYQRGRPNQRTQELPAHGPYHGLPCRRTRPKSKWSCMWNPYRSLPTVSRSCARGANPLVVLVWSGVRLPGVTNRPFWLCLHSITLLPIITSRGVKYTHNDRNSHILYSDSGPTRIRLIPTASTQEVIVVGDGGAQHRSVDPPTDIPQCCRSPGRTRIHTVARTPHPTTRPIWAYDCEHTGEANYFGKDFLRMAGIVQMLHGHDSRRDI